MEPLGTLQRALDDLIAEREQLDEDIAGLTRIISRRNGAVRQPHEAAPMRRSSSATRKPGKDAAPRPGEAREAMLDLMSDGKIWTPGDMAHARNTSPQAATRAFKRMLEENPPPIQRIGKSHRYKLASPKGDAQGALSFNREG